MENKVKLKIQNKEKVIGTFFTMGNISAMECLGYTDLDYVIIDTEHGPFDTETAMNLVRAAESGNLTPFMRIADVTHKEIQRALDIGAQGLIVPCLRTIDEIKKLVDLSKFAPIGNRGFIKGRGSGYGYQDWAAKSLESFMSISNEQVLIIPQCETVECLERIEEVVKIEGIDGIFIGPFDLSITMGIPGQFKNEKFIAAIDRILNACKNAGKPVLIFTANIDDARRYLDAGFDGIAHTIDVTVLVEGYKKIVNSIFK
jgi:4-hydroxy-2-oxoheptanedioate aldolase